jgi:N-methylhydantoinase A
MRVEPELARAAIAPLATAMNKSVEEAATGIIRVAEENMSRAIRAVTSRRGLDPRDFALMSFGGAGGLHACALAESLEIPRVIVPPYCGVLSALGMVAAPPTADASKTVLHIGDGLDDHRLYAEFGYLNMLASEKLPQDQLAAVEAYADLRFAGQSYELTVRARGADRAALEESFRQEYAARYGTLPTDKAIEIVTLRLRRIGQVPAVELPSLSASTSTLPQGAITRSALHDNGRTCGPFLLIDDEATTYVPEGWSATCDSRGIVIVEQKTASM